MSGSALSRDRVGWRGMPGPIAAAMVTILLASQAAQAGPIVVEPAGVPVGLPPGYTATNYRSGLPVLLSIFDLTMDPTTGDLFYAAGVNPAPIYRVPRTGGLSLVSNDGSGGRTYPYGGSDIQYMASGSQGDASVIMAANGYLCESRLATPGAPGVTKAFTAAAEMGLATRSGVLYATRGVSGPQILEVNLASGALTTRVTLPTVTSSLEYEPLTDRFYSCRPDGLVYYSDVDTGAWSFLASHPTTYGNIAVEPSGRAVYSRYNPFIARLDVATHAYTMFAQGLSTAGAAIFGGMTFGPSSTGRGYSLYVADYNAIQEIAGFEVPTLTWASATGAWSNPGNWTGPLGLPSNVPPANGTESLVYLNAAITGGSVTLDASSPASVAVEALAVNGGTLTVAAGRALKANGPLTSASGSVITVNGLLTAVATGSALDGPLVNNGTVDGRSGLVCNGAVSGSGNYMGTVTFNGGFSPGTSPASVSGEFIILGSSNVLTMEIGGTVQGDEYDHITASQLLTLAGTLDVQLINGFNPAPGQSFILFEGPTEGTFSQVNLPDLGAGVVWDTTQLYSSGQIGVASQNLVVPEPATLTLLALGGLGLLARRRRKRA